MSNLIYNDVKEIVKNVVGAMTPTDTLTGTIVSVDPIKVEIDGNSEFYPSENFLVPEYLTDREIEVEYNGTNTAVNEGLAFTGKMTIKNGLQPGDEVLIIQSQAGQKLILIDRV